jgi:hypothetical protein
MPKKLVKAFNFKTFIFIWPIVFLLPVYFVFASITDGTIDSTYKYAWGNKIGWVNFGATNGNVHITDSQLTGYAWSENYGWINLNPTHGGVQNNGEGNLSGYAWARNLGWIDFDNVNINSYGQFTGYASGTASGVINFDCANCKVLTDWRSLSVRGETGVGAGLISGAYKYPAPPFAVLINNGDEYTTSNVVKLQFYAGVDTEKIAVSNYPDFSVSIQELYINEKQWDLCSGRPIQIDCPTDKTIYTVYVKFFTRWGRESEVFSDSIIFTKEIVKKPVAKRLVEKVIPKIPEILKPFIPEFLKPKPPVVIRPIEEVVLKTAPFSMRGKWILIDPKAIGYLVFAPLPKEFQSLTAKIPKLYKTFSDIGVTRFSELEKLRTAKLVLPGLTKSLGLSAVKLEPGKFALPQAVPIAKLSAATKQKIPAEIVFAKAAGELIDYDMMLSLTSKGKPEQRIATIVGKQMILVVKPDKPVKAIKGYIIFRSQKPQPTSMQIPLRSLTASLLFANPILVGPQIKPIEVEEKLVLAEFEYTDLDGDGIYTAEITAPVVEGEYEIITVMDYEDPLLAMKAIKLITVVDPEGYIFEKEGEKETRIPGAVVSLYWLNPETKQYELWPAKEYQQENPQTTDVRGTYSFMVPEGFYYLKVEAPGYLPYDGKPFEVKEGSGIHINIEMKGRYWFVKVIDWKTLLLIIIVLMLLYNFYCDKIREKLTKIPNSSQLNHH